MDLDEYQRSALRTAAPRDKKNELLHLVLGLVGESGEIAEKFKKWVRDLDSEESRIDRVDIANARDARRHGTAADLALGLTNPYGRQRSTSAIIRHTLR